MRMLLPRLLFSVRQVESKGWLAGKEESVYHFGAEVICHGKRFAVFVVVGSVSTNQTDISSLWSCSPMIDSLPAG